MKCLFPWKQVALVLVVSVLFTAGCAKKQTVKSEGAAGGSGTTTGVPLAPAPGAGEVKETPVQEAPPTAGAAAGAGAAPAGTAAAGVAVTEEKPSMFDDVRFDFDKSDLREEGRRTAQGVAEYLKKNPSVKLRIEGHCDERGTSEYNMALGERRANSVSTYLVSLGIPKSRLSTVSFGKERPLDPGHDESAWAKNRRAHFVLQ